MRTGEAVTGFFIFMVGIAIVGLIDYALAAMWSANITMGDFRATNWWSAWTYFWLVFAIPVTTVLAGITLCALAFSVGFVGEWSGKRALSKRRRAMQQTIEARRARGSRHIRGGQ